MKRGRMPSVLVLAVVLILSSSAGAKGERIFPTSEAAATPCLTGDP